MPTVFRKNGFRFFFYSNDHEPIHVHVEKDEGDAKFDVLPEVALVESRGMKTKELAAAEAMIVEHRELIIAKWNQHFN